MPGLRLFVLRLFKIWSSSEKGKTGARCKESVRDWIHPVFLDTKLRAAPAPRAHHHGPVQLVCLRALLGQRHPLTGWRVGTWSWLCSREGVQGWQPGKVRLLPDLVIFLPYQTLHSLVLHLCLFMSSSQPQPSPTLRPSCYLQISLWLCVPSRAMPSS